MELTLNKIDGKIACAACGCSNFGIASWSFEHCTISSDGNYMPYNTKDGGVDDVHCLDCQAQVDLDDAQELEG